MSVSGGTDASRVPALRIAATAAKRAFFPRRAARSATIQPRWCPAATARIERTALRGYANYGAGSKRTECKLGSSLSRSSATHDNMRRRPQPRDDRDATVRAGLGRLSDELGGDAPCQPRD